MVLLGLQLSGQPFGGQLAHGTETIASQPRNIDPCTLHGAVFIEEVEGFGQYKIFREDVEAFSDLLVFKEQARSFADRSGLWYITDIRAQADFTVAFTDVKGFADFSIYYTDFKSLAGCR